VKIAFGGAPNNSPSVGELDIDTRRWSDSRALLFHRYGRQQLVLHDRSRDDYLVGRRRFCSGFIGHIGRGLV
jgi:hypothetical protein